MRLQKMVITFAFTLFFLSVASSAMAQSFADLIISDARWVYDVNRNFNFHSANSTSSKLSPFTVSVLQEVFAVFHNKGNKSIKKVAWEFIVYQDELKTKIKRIYTSRNKAEISPGESVRLSKVGLLYDNSQYQEVKVYQIEYADETIWNGDRTKK